VQETESGLRLKKTRAIQARLLDLLDKEVKAPLSATGTFFDLVDDDHRGTAFGTEVTSKARRQFHRTLTIFDSLLEWGVVHQLDRRRPWPKTDTNQLMRSLFASFKDCTYARPFTLIDRHKSGRILHLPQEELSFVLDMILYWLCEIAEDGEISVDRIGLTGNRLHVVLRLTSGTLFSRPGQKVERFVSKRPSSDDKPFPTEGFYLALARDILGEFNGDLWVKMDADLIVAGFDLDLGA
jgi:hypothetical protein